MKTNKTPKQIFQEMPNWLTMSPSNKCGEAKYNQEYTAFCQAIGFTNDKFAPMSEICKMDNSTMLITYIYTVGEKEHTGYFRNLVKNLQSLGVEVMIDNPSTPRIQEIIERHNLKIACWARLLALGKL